jgi:hypothetical protein
VLDESTEKALVNVLIQLGKLNFSLSYSKLRNFIGMFMKLRFDQKMNIWNRLSPEERAGHVAPEPAFVYDNIRSHLPGRHWVRSFVGRHEELTLRYCTSRRPAEMRVSKEIVRK